jgi:glycosyltransferase involved in cell wall biosynthesis
LRRAGSGGPQTVGFLGRFVEEKGIHVILDAIPRILEKQPETRFILAGDYASVPGGSQLSRLQGKLHALGNRVSTPGKLPEEQLFDFYRSLDLFLLPSINAYEAFGIVQIEAMKAGVPVIASDMRGVREPVRLTGCGSIVPPGDAVALADAVVEWLSGARSLTPEEVASRAWAAFSNRIATERVCAMYREVLSGL